MKLLSKTLTVLLIIITGSCLQEDVPKVPTAFPESLRVIEPIGLALESQFISENVKMNIKVEVPGNYILRIHHLDGRTVAKEDLSVDKGDNLKTFYVGTLPKQPYTLALYTVHNIKLTETIINLY